MPLSYCYYLIFHTKRVFIFVLPCFGCCFSESSLEGYPGLKAAQPLYVKQCSPLQHNDSGHNEDEKNRNTLEINRTGRTARGVLWAMEPGAISERASWTFQCILLRGSQLRGLPKPQFGFLTVAFAIQMCRATLLSAIQAL